MTCGTRRYRQSPYCDSETRRALRSGQQQRQRLSPIALTRSQSLASTSVYSCSCSGVMRHPTLRDICGKKGKPGQAQRYPR